MTAIELSGLDGRNPLAYFAALGCLAALHRTHPTSEPKLAWTSSPISRPVLHAEGLDADAVVAAVDEDRKEWHNATALTFKSLPDVKLSVDQQHRYLEACRAADDGGRSAGLAEALFAEGSFAKTGDGKPTDLHFTAGQQKFLVIARTLQADVTRDDLREALLGPWSYQRSLPTFGWDATDDRVYAFEFFNPGKTEKQTVPGADWLGLLGLSAYKVRGAEDQSVPPGMAGSWKRGVFRWGLWASPIGWTTTKTLVNTGFESETPDRLRTQIFRVYSSKVRRSDQGGYGSFSPPSVLAQAGVISR